MLVCLYTAECCATGMVSADKMGYANTSQLLLDFSLEERWLSEAA